MSASAAGPTRTTPASTLSGDAAVVLALARTALPFALSRLEEAERWLRILRVHGQVGTALQNLGVGEAPFEARADEPPPADASGPRRDAEETVNLVCERATELARRSAAACVGTVHVLLAVVDRYGSAFDHELYRRGTSRDEILAELTSGGPVQSGVA